MYIITYVAIRGGVLNLSKKMNKDYIIVYKYFNYREYLQDYFEYAKNNINFFSHRTFLQKVDIPSSSFMLKIFNEEQKLQEKHVLKFAQALELNEKEASYFSALVVFNNTKSTVKRHSALQSMMKIRRGFPEFVISDEKLKIFSKWYYPVIRELAVHIDFKKDFNYLGRHVIPRLNAAQAKGAVKFLIAHGFLKEKKDKYVRVDPVLSTGDNVLSTILTEYHKNNLSMNIEDFDLFEMEDRDISSLVLSISEKNYLKIKDEIRDFRKKLLAMALDDKKPEKVCYVGFQLVPRSKNICRKDKKNEK